METEMTWVQLSFPAKVNVILAILSFLLTAISVVSVIITLRQNGRAMKNTEEQIAEMRMAHALSLQPVLDFSNAELHLFRPRLYHNLHIAAIRSAFSFCVDIENISQAVAININCHATIMDRIYKDKLEELNISSIKILSGNKKRIEFTLNLANQEKLLEYLTSDYLISQFNISAIFSNTTGGHFLINNGFYYHTDDSEQIETVKKWYSIISDSEVDMKEVQFHMARSEKSDECNSNDKSEGIENKLKALASDEDKITLKYQEDDSAFEYKPLSDMEYTEMIQIWKKPSESPSFWFPFV